MARLRDKLDKLADPAKPIRKPRYRYSLKRATVDGHYHYGLVKNLVGWTSQ